MFGVNYFCVLDNRRRPGVWALAWIVMMGPMFFVDIATGIEFQKLHQASFAVKSLFGLTGFAAYALGGIMATLNQLDGDDTDPRLHRVTPPPGEQRSAP